MRIGVAGAGAIGGWVAAKFSGAGHEVSLLARGTTLDAVRDRGLILREGDVEQSYRMFAADSPAALGEQDILFIAVKAQSLPALAPELSKMVGTSTTIVPLLNGVPWWFMGADQPLGSVDPEGQIRAALPEDQITGAVVHAAAFCPEKGIVQLRLADRLILGAPSLDGADRAEAVVKVAAEAGIPAVLSESIRQEIWYKLWGNMTVNPISALTLATADRILDDELVSNFILSVMSEANAIGEKIGCPIEQSGEERNQLTRKLGAFRTSMLQDTEAGRSIELDALLGAPLEIAAGLGVSTPNLDALFGLARLMGESRGIY
ncbi:2-dehydropantoate 2-reductase [uncultured Parasphingorhabdus sp.]|uniref:2-dehydropantoate 2-reductase n=1 Tax=uncultured Parasphingorhabdus sp. TaxID=2709694 RepID=UPI0030D77056|tara:strand:- start:7555 stop:8511 length:957 start_codon:yes stop_codon:yes gene_type:complete